MKRTGLFLILSVAIAGFICVAAQAQGVYTNLHEFTAGAGDGQYPNGSLTLSGSTLYGMTEAGGHYGNGVIFRTAADGSGYTNLYEFTTFGTDGTSPYGSLTLSGSTLYGMTVYGGAGNGVIFRTADDGSGYTNLHEFTAGAGDGALPLGSLTLSGGTLYGMTYEGGANGSGVIFRTAADGSSYTNLHEFAGGTGDGQGPCYGSLTLSDSTLYGMTREGGASSNGVIFQMAADGSGYTNLHEFTAGAGDGACPYGSLTLSGNTLYGMTYEGGVSNQGVIFQMADDGSGYTNLHEFTAGAGDGAYPYGSLTLSGSTLYGMTCEGGANSGGVIFSYTIPEPGSFLLFGAGLLGLLSFIRRGRKKGLN